MATGKLVTSAAERLEILNHYRKFSMVGLSSNPYRPSHFAAIYMLAEGYRVVPVNPRESEILGQTCFPSILAVAEHDLSAVKMIDLFRRPADIPPLVEEAIEVGAEVVWMQLGVINHEAAKMAVDAGLTVVMDRCVKIEHARFFGGLNTIGLNTGIVSSRRMVLGV